MILDSLKNSDQTAILNTRFREVFDYIKSHDLVNAAPGRIELDGERLYINIDEVQGRTKAEALIETHDEYVDVQVLLKGEECYGWKARRDLRLEKAPYCMEKDITFYGDDITVCFTLQPGEFVVFFPEDGHAPCMGSGVIKKAVAKIKL